jgi:hypothetical protein
MRLPNLWSSCITLALFGTLEGCASAGVARARPCPVSVAPAARRLSEDEVLRARGFFSQGVEFVARRRWGEALDAFRRAQLLVDHPVTSFNIAQTLWRLGRYEDVLEELGHFNIVRDIVTDRALQERAQALLEQARRRVGTLTLDLSPPTATVRIDGVVRALPRGEHRVFHLRPGSHRVELSARGRSSERLVIRTRPGDHRSGRVTLEK